MTVVFTKRGDQIWWELKSDAERKTFSLTTGYKQSIGG